MPMTIPRTALATLLVLGAVGPAAAAPPAARAQATGESPKLLAQDLEARGVEAHEAQALSTATCQAIARRKGYDVLCGEDLRTLMRWNEMAVSFNACRDARCYEPAARALKARFVVSGSIGKIGDQLVLSLALFDLDLGSAIGRSEVKAATIEALYQQVEEAVSALMAKPKG